MIRRTVIGWQCDLRDFETRPPVLTWALRSPFVFVDETTEDRPALVRSWESRGGWSGRGRVDKPGAEPDEYEVEQTEGNGGSSMPYG